ncbi:hypothetical protein HAX54_037807, partial [Datura stramonium]|nr:hypothetical protein [Datura stramonium]
MIPQLSQKAITPLNPIGEATTIRIQGLMKKNPPEVGALSVVGKCRGSGRGNKRLRAKNPGSYMQGSSSGSYSQARQKSLARVRKYKPQ